MLSHHDFNFAKGKCTTKVEFPVLAETEIPQKSHFGQKLGPIHLKIKLANLTFFPNSRTNLPKILAETRFGHTLPKAAVVFGGEDEDEAVLGDCWLLDLDAAKRGGEVKSLWKRYLCQDPCRHLGRNCQNLRSEHTSGTCS